METEDVACCKFDLGDSGVEMKESSSSVWIVQQEPELNGVVGALSTVAGSNCAVGLGTTPSNVLDTVAM
jgi:hypothetical protein